MRPCWVHPCNFLAGGWRGLGDQRTLPPSPPYPRDPSRPALGRHRDPSRRSREAKAWLRHRGLWARPALRPLNGRLCSSPSAAESGPAGAATMGRPPLLRPAPKRCATPSPALRPARSLARRAAADSIASFMSYSLSSRHSPPPSSFFFFSLA